MASASEEGTIESTQPIVTENFIRPCTVTYIWSGMVHVTGSSVARTCFPDLIETDQRADNRNAANLAGLTVALAASDSSWHPLFGDTLRVTLNATSLGEKKEVTLLGSTFTAEGLMDATLDCLEENAGRGVPPAHFLDLRLVGSKRFAKLSRVYRVNRAQERKTYY